MNVSSQQLPRRVPRKRPGPEGGARDANRRHRVAQICEAALTLFLQRGLGEVTIDDIVKKARQAKGSFYRYFSDKEELVETLLEPIAQIFRGAALVLENATAESEGGTYLDVAGAMANAVTSHPDVVRFYLQEARGPAVGARRPVRKLADEIADRAVALGERSRETGMYRDMDSRLVTLSIVGAAERLLYEHLTRKPFAHPVATAGGLVSIFQDGLRPRR
jgi:AcrR family transcriptional regulator